LTWLLVLVGGAAGFGAGWWLGRSRPVLGDSPETTQPGHAEPAVSDVVEHHPTGVVVADPAGVVRYRNAAARALVGTHVGVLIDAAIERHLLAGRGGRVGEEVVELYGPPKRVLDVVSRPLPGGGSVVFVDDITERRRLDQVRTDFVANISHELKTPIGALSVLAETLVDETDPATVSRVVDRMMNEAQRASSTIDDLMELSRIELGGDRVSEPVALADVVGAAVDRVTQLAAQREITILATGAGLGGVGAPITVAGDRPQLVSAVGNLVENAVKYSERGGHVNIRVEGAAEWLEISVIDEGVGIPQRDLSRIFERFYRVDRARSRETGGTGLGLSIVRHVATNHGGEVVVTSVEGQGSTFVLRLPAQLAHDQQQHQHPQEGAA
jgi:two-component system sensor histidine kinase SenX3